MGNSVAPKHVHGSFCEKRLPHKVGNAPFLSPGRTHWPRAFVRTRVSVTGEVAKKNRKKFVELLQKTREAVGRRTNFISYWRTVTINIQTAPSLRVLLVILVRAYLDVAYGELFVCSQVVSSGYPYRPAKNILLDSDEIPKVSTQNTSIA